VVQKLNMFKFISWIINELKYEIYHYIKTEFEAKKNYKYLYIFFKFVSKYLIGIKDSIASRLTDFCNIEENKCQRENKA